jgi:phosphoserine phosphatase
MGLEAFKERFYMSLLSKINDIDAEVEKFWDTHRCRLKTWYLQQREDSDLIISASPEFLLAPICVELNISLIASKVDAKTGRLKGKNCKGSEKVSAFRQLYPTESIEQFYSDSRTDQPLADIAQQSFMVTGDKVLPWPSEANR